MIESSLRVKIKIALQPAKGTCPFLHPTAELGQCPGTPEVPWICFLWMTRNTVVAVVAVCVHTVSSTLHTDP